MAASLRARVLPPAEKTVLSVRVRYREEQDRNAELRGHVPLQVFRNDAAQIERYDRQARVARGQHQSFREQRIVRSIGGTALAVVVTVHRPERGRCDIDLSDARLEL
jgi:hypothetical protein